MNYQGDGPEDKVLGHDTFPWHFVGSWHIREKNCWVTALFLISQKCPPARHFGNLWPVPNDQVDLKNKPKFGWNSFTTYFYVFFDGEPDFCTYNSHAISEMVLNYHFLSISGHRPILDPTLNTKFGTTKSAKHKHSCIRGRNILP